MANPTPPSGEFTVLVLVYGDYPDLARRCFDSILDRLPDPHVAEIRVGMNAVGAATRGLINRLVDQPTPIHVVDSPANVKKYPMMRTLIYGDPATGLPPITTPLVMWFDDDSCIRPEVDRGFFGRAAAQMADADHMGETKWRQTLVGGQRAWIEDQPWYTGKPIQGPPEKRPYVRFPQGGWWCSRVEVLRRYNYPWPELVHRGGDVMWGELCRQQGLRLKDWHAEVAINADAALRNSAALRRGFDAPPIGAKYHRGA